MPFVEAGTVRLHVQSLGTGTPPVLMIHGLLVGSLATWLFTAGRRLAQSRRVVLYDLRGHGLSERPPTGYDLETQRRDLEALRTALNLTGPIDLVGHSYGALVALAAALDDPRSVRRLVLVEAPLPPSRAGEVTGFLGRTPQEMIAALPEAQRERVTKGGRRARRLLASLQALATGTSLLSDLAAEADFDDARVRCLDRPVRLVYGRRSGCLGAAERLRSALPQAELVLLDGGHFLPVEAPEALSAAVAGFLDG